MPELNKSIPLPLPRRIAALAIDARGFPVPWFVATINGVPDFRVIKPDGARTAHRHGLCWICGGVLGVHKVFPIGPMCAVNRISAEPPSHLDCATFAVKACPFLANPSAKRNEKDIPAEGVDPPGIFIKRNPAVIALWVTRSYKIRHEKRGVLFQVGEPERVEWWREGRTATREEVVEAMETGCPILREAAERDGKEAMALLESSIAAAAFLIPPAPATA